MPQVGGIAACSRSIGPNDIALATKDADQQQSIVV
jgi:hypothetical protein